MNIENIEWPDLAGVDSRTLGEPARRTIVYGERKSEERKNCEAATSRRRAGDAERVKPP